MADWESVRDSLEAQRIVKKNDIISLFDAAFCPADLRKLVWPILLKVQGKPDTITPRKIAVDKSSPLYLRCKTLLAQRGQVAEEDLLSLDDDSDDDGASPGERGSHDQDKALSLAQLLSAFAQTRGKTSDFIIDSDWPEIASVFFSVGMPVGDTYNCFYAFQVTLGFADLADTGAIYEVFRLMLQYHEPDLCQFLDSRRIHPFNYLSAWFRGLFSSACDQPVLLALWDRYLSLFDPFLVLFLSLVMVVNAKDFLAEMDDDKNAMIQFLRDMPSNIAEGDVNDLIDLGQHYSTITPPTLRDEFTNLIFGTSAASNKASSEVAEMLCFDIEPAHLLPRVLPNIEIALIDVRPEKEYALNHVVNTSHHLCATTLLNDPEQFDERLMQIIATVKDGSMPVCFLGSGDPALLRMVVSRCLQHNVPHVTIARGGFAALFEYAKETESIPLYLEGKKTKALPKSSADAIFSPESASPSGPSASSSTKKSIMASFSALKSAYAASRAKSKAATSGGPGEVVAENSPAEEALQPPSQEQQQQQEGDADHSQTSPDEASSSAVKGSKWSSWASSYKAKTSQLGQALRQKSAEYSQKISTKSKELSTSMKATLLNVESRLQGVEPSSSTSTSHGRAYRANEIKSNFSIDDDEECDVEQKHAEEERGVENDLASAILKRIKGELIVDVAKVEQESGVLHMYPMSEVHDTVLYPSHLVFTKTHIIKLREIQGGQQRAAVMWRRKLVSVVRVTARKKMPTLLTFLFVGDHVNAEDVALALDAAAKQAHETAKGALSTGVADDAARNEAHQAANSGDTADTASEAAINKRKAKISLPGTFKERFLCPQAAEMKSVLKQMIDDARKQEYAPSTPLAAEDASDSTATLSGNFAIDDPDDEETKPASDSGDNNNTNNNNNTTEAHQGAESVDASEGDDDGASSNTAEAQPDEDLLLLADDDGDDGSEGWGTDEVAAKEDATTTAHDDDAQQQDLFALG